MVAPFRGGKSLTVFLILFALILCNEGGTNTGVMKHVGEAVKEQEITFGSEDKVNVIGIATWGIVDRKDSLIARKVKYMYSTAQK